MTIKSRLPLFIYQKYFEIKDKFTSLLRKLEVIADSAIIINAVRIFIVLIALLMGYLHTVKKEEEMSKVNTTEIHEPNSSPIDSIMQN